MGYDSTQDTLDHIKRVKALLLQIGYCLSMRAACHDQSKLSSPEKEVFDVVTPKLKELTYGSDEYKAMLGNMETALRHHYQKNSHHPEYYKDGIDGMDLVDVVEMLCDWKAATERHENGDIRNSLVINASRFGISEQLADILLNTVERLRW